MGVTQVARRARISRQTLHRWLRSDRKFTGAIADESAAVMEASAPKVALIYERAMDGALRAIAIIDEIQRTPAKRFKAAIAGPRINAAVAMLNAARAWHQEFRTAAELRRLTDIDAAQENALRMKARGHAPKPIALPAAKPPTLPLPNPPPVPGTEKP